MPCGNRHSRTCPDDASRALPASPVRARLCALQDKESTDPNRVGGPNNPLLEGGGLTTVIARGQGDGSSNLNRLHMRK